jgi:2-haloacid dehalogenase
VKPPAITRERYTTLTFDCYGTLIDWEAGLLGYLRPLLARYDVHAIDDFVLEAFAAIEPQVQAGGGNYRDVLTEVVRRLGCKLAFTPDEAAAAGLADSIAQWPPFPDSVRALQLLARNYQLAVLSNVDDDLFEHSRRVLGAPFATIVTAQRVGAYKPDPRMFETLMGEVEGPILHVAQSRWHDIVPATALGLDTVWIDRPSLGAARPVDAQPTYTFDSLQSLAEAAC